MATRWRVLNRRRARKIRIAQEPEWFKARRCDHDWFDDYYGNRCRKCDTFYAFGCAPWDQYDDGDDYSGYEPHWFDEDDEYEWECAFGVRCLMHSVPHLRSQCYTREMAEAWADEAAQNS